MRKAGNHEPTASQMVFVGTRFSIGLLMQPGKRAGQLDLMEKRVPTRTIGRGFENASGLGFWTSHPLHHAHVVNRQSHVRPEPCEARAM